MTKLKNFVSLWKSDRIYRAKKGKGKWSSEVVFSSFKRNFGEYFAAKKMENIRNEILRKAYVHNLLMNHLARC